jgi:GT2 family glycosyltransferase
MRIAFFSATRKTDPKDTALLKSIKEINLDINIAFDLNNSEGLPKAYNKAIDKALEEDWDALVLAHDDIWLEYDPTPKLIKLFEKYDLIGVAGTSQINLKSPALWHIMGGGFGGGNLHGAVAHGNETIKNMTNFGPYPHRVVMLDGVFMAMNRKVIETARFDITNPAKAHFYDLDFSLNCHKMGHKVGVGDIYINHESPGLKEFTDEWKAAEKWFLNKYES